jgi:hypothetical protein
MYIYLDWGKLLETSPIFFYFSLSSYCSDNFADFEMLITLTESIFVELDLRLNNLSNYIW